MPAGPFIVFAKSDLTFAAGFIANSSQFRWALIGSVWVPDVALNEVLANVTGELATGNGYTAGGIAMTGASLDRARFTGSPVVWTASGAGIPVWRYALLYWLGTLSSKVNPLVGYFVGDSAPADVPLTPAAQTITLTLNGLGLIGA